MPDQYGRFNLQDGMQIYGALRGMRRDQRELEAFDQKAESDQKLKEYSGALQQDPEFQPDREAEGFDPVTFTKAKLQEAMALNATEEGKVRREQFAQQRVDIQRQNIMRGAADAAALYQTDPQAGTIAMLKTYDQLHDGIELVKDENGNPVIDDAGKITLKSLSGTETKADVPPMNDMIKMAQMYSDPKKIQEVDTMSKDAYVAWNASQFAKGKQHMNDRGEIAILSENVYDPITRTKQTVWWDPKRDRAIDPEEIAQGGYREVSHESREKHNDQMALKGVDLENDKKKLDYEYGLKTKLEQTKGGVEGKNDVGSANANRELNLAFMFLKKSGAAPISFITEEGTATPEGASVVKEAEDIFYKHAEKFNNKNVDTSKLNITEKREFADFTRAKTALEVYSNMSDKVAEKWAGRKPASALAGGGGGGGKIAQDEKDPTIVFAKLAESGLSKEAIMAELKNRFPGLKMQDDMQPGGQQLGVPTAAAGQSAAVGAQPAGQPQAGAITQKIQSEFLELKRTVGPDRAKAEIRKRYPNVKGL